MVDLSLVEPGMHLKVVDDFDVQPGTCYAVPNMYSMSGKIVTCARKYTLLPNQHGGVADGTPSRSHIYLEECGCAWNDYCFDYIVELQEDEGRFADDALFDLSELFGEV